MERNDLMHEDEEYEPEGRWGRLKQMLGFGGSDGYAEEDEDDAPAPVSRPAPPRNVLRVESARSNAIYVRLDFRSMQDAQAASDRLKERRPVIVNFEHTDEDVARRGVDFISGVTYALDGFYEKVGEKVFLFTPSNTPIAVEDKDVVGTGSTGLYMDTR